VANGTGRLGLCELEQDWSLYSGYSGLVLLPSLLKDLAGPGLCCAVLLCDAVCVKGRMKLSEVTALDIGPPIATTQQVITANAGEYRQTAESRLEIGDWRSRSRRGLAHAGLMFGLNRTRPTRKPLLVFKWCMQTVHMHILTFTPHGQ
jgi:hypothetical protein